VSLHRDLEFQPLTDPDDPDDWRPNSLFALVADDETDMAVIAEKIAVGDAIPRHLHRIDEVIVFLSGAAEVRVGEDVYHVQTGDIVFIPAGKVHGTRNTGDEVVEIRAAFPKARLDIQYVERNPAPGTEGNAPQPPVVVDTHTGAVGPVI
jgi:quercetin dioxygenase-like cupin family protein